MIVTAVVAQPRRKKVSVFIDDREPITIGAALAVERDIRPGRVLQAGELASLTRAEEQRSALDASMRLLSYRPRSEQELRQRLRRRGFRRPAIDEALRRLRELGYVDDAAFARFYAETQHAARPRSRRLLAAELRRRGITLEAAEEATASLSDEEAAYEAARRRLRLLRELEYHAFRERLGAFLTRRGFSYEVARSTIERCWGELGAAEAAPAPE